MRRINWFRVFYLAALSVFVLSTLALVFRLREQHRGSQFYQRLGAVNEPVSAFDFPSFLTAAFRTQPVLLQGQEYQNASYKPSELSARVSRLAGEYSHIVAWLQIPDTSIDYPVVLGKDNQFYLDHLPDGSKNVLGSLFLDCRSKEDSPHLIIYGHNAVGGKMFGQLKQYESQEFFAEHGTIILATQNVSYACPIFSIRRVREDSDDYVLDFEDRDALLAYVNEAAANSLYSIDVDFHHVEGVVTLSTCTGLHNQRFIVQAVVQSPLEIISVR